MGLEGFLHRDDLPDDTREAVERARVLHELALGMLGAQSLGGALELCLDASVGMPGIDVAAFYLLSDDGLRLALDRHRGLLHPDTPERIREVPVTDERVEAVAANPAVYTPLADVERMTEGRMRAEKLTSVGVIPVLHDARLVGALNVGSRSHDDIPTEVRPTLEMIAALASNWVARSRIAEAASESDVRSAALVESASDAIFTVGPEAVFLSVNPAAAEALNAKPEDIVGKAMSDVFPREVAERQWSMMRSVFETGEGTETARAPTVVAGRERWYNTRLTPVKNADGEVLYVLGIARDVTDRVLAQQALQESQNRYRTLVDAVPDAVVVMDRDGVYISANRKAAEGVDLTPEELRGRRLSDFVSEEMNQVWLTRVREVMDTGRMRTYADHNDVLPPRWVTVTLAPAMGDQGTVDAVLAIASDITERKRTEDALRESEKRYRTLVDSAPDGIVLFDRDGVHLSVNRMAASGSGKPPEALVGTKLSDWVPEDQAEMGLARIREVFDTGESGSYTDRTDDEGSPRWLHHKLTPVLGDGGQVESVLAVTREITTEMLALGRLAESEKRYRTLVDSVPAAILLFDGDGVCLSANPMAVSEIPQSQEEIVGMRLHEWMPKEEADRGLARIQRSHRTGEASSHLDRAETDPTRWFALTLVPITGEGGEVESVLAISREVTTEKVAEEALAESERRYRALVDSAPDPIMTFSADGVFLSVNPAAAALLRRSPEDIVGRRLHDIAAAPAADARVARIAQVLATGAPTTVQERGAVPGNEANWYFTTFAPVIGEAGKAPSVLALVKDVTEQVRAEEALRESQARYAMAASAGRVGAWDHVVGSSSMFIDPALRGIIGYTEAELPDSNRGWLQLVPPEDAAMLEAALTACMRDGTNAFEAMPRVRHRDGTDRWLTVRGTVSPGKPGEPLRLVGTATDVTEAKLVEDEQRRLEERIQQSQKLESLGVFAGGVAHDLRNLVSGILSGTHEALARAQDAPEAREAMEQVLDVAERAADLSNQVLAYAGRSEVVPQSVDLSALAGETVELVRTTAPARVRLRTELGDDLPEIAGDPTQLGQVVLNLLTNAIDAVGEGDGEVAVRTLTRDLDEASIETMYLHASLEPGPHVILEVADNGCGMDEDVRGKILDPFFTTKPHGRGLGLAAAFGIIRAHHGAIDIYSEPGRGTTMKILLPSGAPVVVESETEAVPTGHQWRGSGAVLVADDEPIIRWAAKMELEGRGYVVVLASDGAEAVQQFGERPDIVAVVLDVTMPRMSGPAAFAEIQRLRPGTPVVMTSGFSEDEAAVDTNGGRPAGFIRKPHEPGALANAVRNALG